MGFPGDSVVKNPPSGAGDARDVDLLPELGRSPEGGNGNPLKYSCWDYLMDRGAWRAIVHWAANQLSKQANNVRMCINRILLMVFTHCHNETKTFWFITLALVMDR